MTAARLFLDTWNWQPSVIAGCLALLGLYLAACRPRPARLASFLLGDLAILLALVSPLDVLGDKYLFSAHMLQHLLLLSVAPPLLILGLEGGAVRAALRRAWLARAERALGNPAAALGAAVIALWAWHAPALYNAALANENVHVVEHLTFLVTATMLWWPVLAPPAAATGARRLAGLPAAFYLFLAMAGDALLGILLTFTPPGWYPIYLHPVDAFGILPLLRDVWGLSPALDQQLAGLLMWIPGSLPYLAGIILILVRWFEEPEEDLESYALSYPNTEK